MTGESGKHLTAAMLYYMFNAANMHRWNDHFRTVDFTELDKQAHKAAIAWYLGKGKEDAGEHVDWEKLIKHMLFSFIHRIAITDLKPPVYYRLIGNPTTKKKIDDYAVEEFGRLVPDMDRGFCREFQEYVRSDKSSLEDQILEAAHHLATNYEFDLIYPVNSSVIDIKSTRSQIKAKTQDVYKFVSTCTLSKSSFKKFINLVGQLRCQQRWARTPREPKTTVLGHCIFVANTAFLNDLDKRKVAEVSSEQIYNDFFTGLFHDLPEVLTKDVITPVKKSFEDETGDLGNIERDMFHDKVERLVPEGWIHELKGMALQPFEKYDGMERDHGAVKACDWLAAWIEAYVSIQYGVSSKTLRDAEVQTAYQLTSDEKGGKIGAAKLILDFEKMTI